MAHLSRRQGDFDRAAALYEREQRPLPGDWGSPGRGRLADQSRPHRRASGRYRSRHRPARAESGCAADTWRPAGNVSTALANLGMAYLRRGDADQARERFERAWRFATRWRPGRRLDRRSRIWPRSTVARSQAERALRLWAAAAALRDAIGAPLAPSERASYDVVISDRTGPVPAGPHCRNVGGGADAGDGSSGGVRPP